MKSIELVEAFIEKTMEAHLAQGRITEDEVKILGGMAGILQSLTMTDSERFLRRAAEKP